MGRVFTINFPYNGNTYTAVISQIEGSISIYIPDETLHSILPKGKIAFNPQQGIPIDAPEFNQAQDLVVSILGAIEEKFSDLHQVRKGF